jgi:hypothetical protein
VNSYTPISFGAITAVVMNIPLLQDMTPCRYPYTNLKVLYLSHKTGVFNTCLVPKKIESLFTVKHAITIIFFK